VTGQPCFGALSSRVRTDRNGFAAPRHCAAEGLHRAAASQANERGEPSATDRQRALTWAQRLKRVFVIDIEIWRRCGGKLRVIASIDEQATIEQILEHLGRDGESVDPAHPSRAPPQGDLLF
jgi:hypothetical protein